MRLAREAAPATSPSANPFVLEPELLAVLTGSPRDERVHSFRERGISCGCNSGLAHAPGSTEQLGTEDVENRPAA